MLYKETELNLISLDSLQRILSGLCFCVQPFCQCWTKMLSENKQLFASLSEITSDECFLVLGQLEITLEMLLLNAAIIRANVSKIGLFVTVVKMKSFHTE